MINKIKNLVLFFVFFCLLCFTNFVTAENIKINVYVSPSLSNVIKEAADDFKKSNPQNISFNFDFTVASNSILLGKINQNNNNSGSFDLLFCDSQEITQMALQQNLIHQRYPFLSDSLWAISSKNLTKPPQNLQDLQDFHIRRILVSQSADDKIFTYLTNVFQQTENYKIWNVLQDEQKKIFYTNSVQQNLELLTNNQAEVSFALLSDIIRFGKDKIQLSFEFNLGENIMNYFSAVNATKDYQQNKQSKEQYEIMQNFLDYLRNPENKNYENFVKIYKKYGYQAAKQEELKVQF